MPSSQCRAEAAAPSLLCRTEAAGTSSHCGGTEAAAPSLQCGSTLKVLHPQPHPVQAWFMLESHRDPCVLAWDF